MRLLNILGIICMLLMVSCKPKSVTTEELFAFVNNTDNGFIRSEQIGGYELTVIHQPAELKAALELQDTIPTDAGFKQLLEVKKETMDFIFRIGSKDQKGDALEQGISNLAQYQDRLGYLASAIHHDFMLVNDKDTIPCILHHYERNFQMAHFHQVLLSFKRPENMSDEIRVIYNDRLLGTGKVQFVFKKERINNIPEINI